MIIVHKIFGHIQKGPDIVKSVFISLVTLAPSLLASTLLVENNSGPPYPYMIACVVLLWAVIDFIIVCVIEPYRKKLGALTIPAFIGAIFIVLAFVIAESINRFFEHVGYAYLTPFTIGAALLLAAAVFSEKNIALKLCLSLNGIALALLWALGAADKVTLPF